MDTTSWLNRHWNMILDDIALLVSIPSVSWESNDSAAPFGEECKRALEAALTIGFNMGFSATNHEGYCGTLLWKGKQEEEIGIFVHLDVVPEGSDWQYEPFAPTRLVDKMVGRGTGDNKGPAIIALYALKCLKDSGYKPNHSIRFFFGLNEESGMKDIEYYLEHNPMPVFSFTPDAAFPVCFAEKGTLEIHADFELKGSLLTDFSSGVASNTVPSYAQAKLSLPLHYVAEKILENDSIKLSGDHDSCIVQAYGIAAHAAFPQGSISAQVELAKTLTAKGLLDEKAENFLQACTMLFADYYGLGLGVPYEDDISGKLTHVGGMARIKDGIVTQNINIRYPVKADSDLLKQVIQNTLMEYGFVVKRMIDSKPCFVNREDPGVVRLTQIANATLQTELEPYSMGGGTYARKLIRAVGYGPGLPESQSDFGSTRGKGHQADEYVSYEMLKKAFAVYVQAIAAIDELV